MAATRDRRVIAPVDYSALEAGLSPGLKGAEKSTKSMKTKTSTSSLPPTQLSVPSDDAQLIRSALVAAKVENEALRRASELRVLQRELSSVQQQNARLKGELEDPPLPSTLTVPSSVPPPLRSFPCFAVRNSTAHNGKIKNLRSFLAIY